VRRDGRDIVGADRDVPTRLAGWHAEQLRELEQPVHDVPLAPWRQPRVREQPLVIARTRLVETDPKLRAHGQAHDVGARRRVHVQQRVETLTPERPAHGAVAAPPHGLVQHDEFDALEAFE
jgi:hypothetical protein